MLNDIFSKYLINLFLIKFARFLYQLDKDPNVLALCSVDIDPCGVLPFQYGQNDRSTSICIATACR